MPSVPGGEAAPLPPRPEAGPAAGRAAIVGAGIVGLSVAWFLQEAGFDVTVYDRSDVAAGASAGNAGWICPAMVTPLPEPSVLRYGLVSLVRPNSPVRIPPSALAATTPFLAAFAAHCTSRQWRVGVAKFAQLTSIALDSYDAMTKSGVMAAVTDSAMLTVFEHQAQADPLRHELKAAADFGVEFSLDEVSQSDLHDQQPLLGRRARYGLRVGGQRFLQPLEFVRSLAAAVANRGQLVTAAHVTGVSGQGHGARLEVSRPDASRVIAEFDVCVLASGAWISDLARQVGVRVRVQAGRGYSFIAPTSEPLREPLYFPALRVACTPAPGGMRLAGTMEFRGPDDPLDRRRIAAIVRSARDFMPDVGWSDRSGEWVGPRPVTADGLPIIGRTTHPNIFVAGGHGMWGMTLGPATGRMLAELIVTGECPQALVPFDPLR